MAGPDILEILDGFRAAVLRRDMAALTRIMAGYAEVRAGIRRELAALEAEIVEDEPTPSQLHRSKRLRDLLDQLGARMADLGQRNAGVTALARAGMASMGATHTAATLAALDVNFNVLPHGALDNLIAALGEKSPLTDLFTELGGDAVTQAREAIIASVGLGRHPRVIADALRDVLAGNMVRATTIARSESLRAYREATKQTYQENRRVVKGWQWLSAATTRTCPFCWARHGSEHDVNESMATHPRCRCTMVPITDGRRKLVEDGESLFRALPEADQFAVLGPRKFELFQSGQIRLVDLIGERRDHRWGPVGYERGIRDALEAARLRREREPERPPEPKPAPRPRKPKTAAPAPKPKPPGAFPAAGFKTVKEAEAWATVKYPHVRFDFKGAHPDAINPTLRQLDKLMQEYPHVAERLRYVGTYRGEGAPRNRWNGNVYAHATFSGERIGLNPKWYGKPNAFRESVARSATNKYADGSTWHPDGMTQIESVVTHEFGHLLDGWLRTRTKEAFDPIVRASGFGLVSSTHEKFKFHNKADSRLSRYATTNRDEAFAEGFGALYHGTRDVQRYKYVKALRKWVELTRPERLTPDGAWMFQFDAPQEQRAAAWERLRVIAKRLGIPEDAI